MTGNNKTTYMKLCVKTHTLNCKPWQVPHDEEVIFVLKLFKVKSFSLKETDVRLKLAFRYKVYIALCSIKASSQNLLFLTAADILKHIHALKSLCWMTEKSVKVRTYHCPFFNYCDYQTWCNLAYEHDNVVHILPFFSPPCLHCNVTTEWLGGKHKRPPRR